VDWYVMASGSSVKKQFKTSRYA
jgi:hypothetical protein